MLFKKKFNCRLTGELQRELSYTLYSASHNVNMVHLSKLKINIGIKLISRLYSIFPTKVYVLFQDLIQDPISHLVNVSLWSPLFKKVTIFHPVWCLYHHSCSISLISDAAAPVHQNTHCRILGAASFPELFSSMRK